MRLERFGWGKDEFAVLIQNPTIRGALLVAFTILLGTISSFAANWTQINTPSAFTEITYFNVRASNNEWYVSDRIQGFAKSTDQGATWTTINGTIPIGGLVGGWTIQANPSDGSLVASTVYRGASGVIHFYRSTDDGNTWSTIGATGYHNANGGAYTGCIMPLSSGGNLVCGGFFGSLNTSEFYSSNNGVTTTLGAYSPGNGSVFALVRNPVDGSYWGGTENNGTYRSTNGGATFSQIWPAQSSPNNGNQDFLTFDTAGNVLVSCIAGLYRGVGSGNGPYTWTRVIPNGNTSAGLGLVTDSSGNIYWGHGADTSNPTVIYRSTDNGVTWSAFDTGLPQGLEGHHMEQSPVDGNIYAVIENGQTNVGFVYRIAVSSGTGSTGTGGTGSTGTGGTGSTGTGGTGSTGTGGTGSTGTGGTGSTGTGGTGSTGTGGTGSTGTGGTGSTGTGSTGSTGTGSGDPPPTGTTSPIAMQLSLPSAHIGAAYSGSVSGSGGAAPYHYSIVQGALPIGVVMNSNTGSISGVPDAVGTFGFTVSAVDSKGQLTTHSTLIPVLYPSDKGIVGFDVVMSPIGGTIASGRTQQFVSHIQGTAPSPGLRWSASGGTISSSGLFTAPKVSSNTTVTITVTSVANTSKNATAIMTITPATPATGITVGLSPLTASLSSGSTQQFSATVQGTNNTAVTWSASAGSISSAGLFTAPTVSSNATVRITVTSVANTSKNATATMTITPPTSTSGITVAVSPSTASLSSGSSQQFSATVQGTSNTAVTWSASAGSVSSAGLFTAPQVTASTSVTVTATSVANTTKKSSASVAILPGTTALTVTTPGLPGATSGTAYSYPLSASGGTSPYQWTVASGSLPTGFSLASGGQLSGNTTQTGTFSFTAKVTDTANHSASQAFALAVSAPSVTGGGTGYDGPAQLPQVYIQSSMANTPSPGAVTLVPAGGSLQAALNSANCGDTIELAAGATYAGVFTLPAKACDDLHWITIRTSAPDTSLPPEGSRMTPCYAGVSSLPGRPSFNCASPTHALASVIYNQVASGSGPFKLASGATHYRLLGLEITRTPGTGYVGPLVFVPSGKADHFILDRVWLHGSPQDETQTGINLNGMTYAAVINSYLDDFHCTSMTGACTDGHAVSGGTSGSQDGPFQINGNFLEASTEAILFGGGWATATPGDIEIRHNHFFKPLTWLKGQAGFVGGTAGNPFMVKNHLELKNAQRVLIEGNIFENTWGGFSQNGYSILLTPKNQAGSANSNLCPICQTTDVTIRYNTLSHAGAGISLADVPSDNGGIALAGERYSIHDVTIDDVNAVLYQGSGTLFQVFNGWPTNALNSISINHVTGFPDPSSRIISLGNTLGYQAMYNFVMQNSIIGQAHYPIWSTGGLTNCALPDMPLPSLNACFPKGYTFATMAIIATPNSPANWPTGNYFPTSVSTVQFTNFNNGNGGDYTLLSSSPYKNAGSDGKDLGANISAIQSAIAGVY